MMQRLVLNDGSIVAHEARANRAVKPSTPELCGFGVPRNRRGVADADARLAPRQDAGSEFSQEQAPLTPRQPPPQCSVPIEV